MADNKVTNLTYLTDLSKGNSIFIKEMIDIFLTENPKEIKDLEQAIFDNDHKLIKSVAHHMKSTIPFVGLDTLIGKDLVEIEKLAMEDADIEKIKPLFAKVKMVCEKAHSELNSQ